MVAVERGDMEEPAALLRSAPPHVVDDQPAHDARRVRHEPRLIGEHRAFGGRNRQIRLVQQRRHTEDADAPPAVQFTPGEPV
jgi:hypothetical protein